MIEIFTNYSCNIGHKAAPRFLFLQKKSDSQSSGLALITSFHVKKVWLPKKSRILFFYFFLGVCRISLFYSCMIQSAYEKLIGNTNDGYQLTIFQLEFYFFLIVLYSFRPSRFNKTIVKSYKEGGTEKFSKKTFLDRLYRCAICRFRDTVIDFQKCIRNCTWCNYKSQLLHNWKYKLIDISNYVFRP